MLQNQKEILIPQASYGGSIMQQFGSWHDPDKILDWFLADARTIGIIPFLWAHPGTTGTRDIPELRDAYTAIGSHIANGDPLPLRGELTCFGSGGQFECNASASRGVPPYQYEWTGAVSSGSFAIYTTICGIAELAKVTIIDSANNSVTEQQTLNCAPVTDPP